MANKKILPPETSQEGVLTSEVARETAVNSAEEAELVTYQVSAPKGIYLRLGPGRAYLPLAVLPDGALVRGPDLTGALRPDRRPGDSAWLKVLAEGGGGWVDGAFLDRIC